MGPLAEKDQPVSHGSVEKERCSWHLEAGKAGPPPIRFVRCKKTSPEASRFVEELEMELVGRS